MLLSTVPLLDVMRFRHGLRLAIQSIELVNKKFDQRSSDSKNWKKTVNVRKFNSRA